MENQSTISPSLSTPRELFEALSKAQAKIEAPLKNRKVDFKDKNGRAVKYAYADLADVMSAIRGPLSENGLAIIHQLELSPNGYFLITTLGHSSGQSISTTYPLPNPLTDQIRAQEFGSALTYARRYSVSSLVGIASEEDDDGQAAAPVNPPKKKAIIAPAAPVIKKPDPEEDHPQDFFPQDYSDQGPPPEELPPVTLLDQLVFLAEERSIPNDKMKDIIKKTVGSPKRAKDLSDEELLNVINAIKKLF
jgi:hypothetical protein